MDEKGSISPLIHNLIQSLENSPDILQFRAFKKRMNMSILFLVIFLFGTFGFLMIVSEFAQEYSKYAFLLVIAAFFSIFAFMISTSKKTQQHAERYKTLVVEKLIRDIDKRFQYSPLDKISKEDFVDAGLFNYVPNRYKGSDLFSLNGKVNVKFSDVKAKRKSGGGKSSRTRTIFKGQFYIFDLHEKLSEGPMYFLRGKEDLLTASLGKVMKIFGGKGRGVAIPISDPAIGNEFRMFAPSEDIGMSFSNKFLSIARGLRSKYPERAFVFSFKQHRFSLGFSGRSNRFECSFAREILNPKILQLYIDDFKESIDIVDFALSELEKW